jgi:hypothetical protein
MYSTCSYYRYTVLHVVASTLARECCIPRYIHVEARVPVVAARNTFSLAAQQQQLPPIAQRVIGGVHVRARVKKSFFCKDIGQPTFLHIMNPHGLEALKQQ